MRAGLALMLAVVLGLALAPAERPAQDWSPERVLWAARTREVPASVRTRVRLRAHTELGAASTSSAPGALALQRPGRARLDVSGPLGGAPVLSIASDGERVSVRLPRGGDPWVARHAEGLIRGLTDGLGSVDDAVAVLLGDLALRDAPVIDLARLPDGSTQVVVAGPAQSRMVAQLDALTATPRRVELHSRLGERLIRVRYGAFVPVPSGALAPRAVVVELPALEGTLELQYEGWDAVALAAGVFEL